MGLHQRACLEVTPIKSALLATPQAATADQLPRQGNFHRTLLDMSELKDAVSVKSVAAFDVPFMQL